MIELLVHTPSRDNGGSTHPAAMDLHALLVRSLEERWARYTSELQRCQTRCSERAVHDLRVASRRLISTIDVIMTVTEDEGLKKVRQTLRKRFKMLGALRDLQVQRKRLEAMRPDYPELEAFLAVLLLREKRLLKRIDVQLRKVRVGPMGVRIGQSMGGLGTLLKNPSVERAARSAVVGAVAASFARAVDLRCRVDPGRTATIHRLRLAFKKFRYQVEALQPLLIGMSERRLKAMNTYQVKMGNIQDNEVLSAWLNTYALRRRKPSRENLLRVHQELSRQHEELVALFMQSVDDLYTFWDSGPNATRLAG